ncbi:hypothetical protein BDQ17DRAFT_1387225 [Cyathus striatus]|nr:hypothetical protein BDQ17DRAFT_1387225 [Cyathus striatus]
MICRTYRLAALSASVSAKTVVITVGGNTTENPGNVFQPESVTANGGDIVRLTVITNGNHTATQSTFASPCIPAHDTNETINSFDSTFDNTTTIWFYDVNTCAEGGVGAININTSSLQTLDGFQRNAIRLNGTQTSSSTSTSTDSSNDATRTVKLGAAAALPLLLAAFAL